MVATLAVIVRIDLYDPASYAGGQPHDQFAWLRANDPVYRHPCPDGDFWAVTRYRDVVAVSKDPGTYSSAAKGIHIGDVPDEDLQSVRNMMLYMDPPRHLYYRRLVNRPFNARQAEAMRSRIAELASQIVDAVAARGECDLVTDVAGELPSYVIAEMMGIPLDDGRRLYELTEKMHAAPGAISEAERMQAVGEMIMYAADVANTKRTTPADDVASRLIASEVDGDRLNAEEFNWFFLLLVNAGGDTTRNLVAGGMLALFEHPDERRRLQDGLDALLPTATEELLRWVSPVVYMRRTATRDTKLGGRTIKTGDAVVMYYGSANRDGEAFAEAERLDVGRTPNEHVGFGGGGHHFCLGAWVARVEIQTMLREILTRMPDVEQCGEAEWPESNFICGPKHLPVRFTSSRR
jgi:cytochrome P450